MPRWRPQPFKQAGLARDVDGDVLASAVNIGKEITGANPEVQPVFTLRHLAHLADVEYGVLRAIASRSLADPYRTFRIRKRPAHDGERRFRIISVPSVPLMQVQRWILKNILQHAAVHSASVAFGKEDNIVDAAASHLECRWLLKLDIQNFFESISEVAVYRVFRSMKFQPLVSFEMTRLCTRLGKDSRGVTPDKWRANKRTYSAISAYSYFRMGHLPQGAPTSPMLANLAMLQLDAKIEEIAVAHNMAYTRYADDIALSTRSKSFDRKLASKVIADVYQEMSHLGLRPNATKTRIASPGARKVVLGLLVDGDRPRLSREFKERLRQHLYYLGKANVGPTVHAAKRNFASTQGLRNHVLGLISYAKQVELDYGNQCRAAFDKISWPI